MARENDDGVSKLGLRTKASTALALVARSSKSARHRKFFTGGEMEFARGACVKLRRRRRLVVRQESSVLPCVGGPINKDRQSSRPNSDRVADSWCSSNYSSEHLKERIEYVDVEEENGEDEGEASMYYGDRERNSETIPPSNDFHTESENLDPMEGTNGENSSCPSLPDKTPSDAELEEFFLVAEKDNLKRFEQKYNYDVLKDEPLEGRYEWVRPKP